MPDLKHFPVLQVRLTIERTLRNTGISIESFNKIGEDFLCGAKRRTKVGRDPARTTTAPCAKKDRRE
jgi:hypothetical protein